MTVRTPESRVSESFVNDLPLCGWVDDAPEKPAVCPQALHDRAGKIHPSPLSTGQA